MRNKLKQCADTFPKRDWFFFTLFALILLSRPSIDLENEDTDIKRFENKNAGKSLSKQGIDVSHFQGNIDWSAVKENTAYVYLKATDGITYTDPRFDENASQTTKRNIFSGAYHFYEPDDDATAQAVHFVQTIKQYPLALRPVLDIEITRGKTEQQLSHGAETFLSYVEKHTGCKPIIYTYASYWDNNLGKAFDDYSFWLAGYTKKPEPPRKRSQYSLWQYSEKGFIEGIEGAVDRDLYHGNQTGFNDLFCPNTRKFAENT